MAISEEAFRDVLRCFPSGVTLVTCRYGKTVHGMTATAFSSVSADPPLVAVNIDRSHSVVRLLEHPGARFAINFLSEGQSELADRFAYLRDADRFGEGRWSRAPGGSPVLVDGLAWLECRVTARHPAGSHIIYLGGVEAAKVVQDGGLPLLYWNRSYRRLEPPAS